MSKPTLMSRRLLKKFPKLVEEQKATQDPEDQRPVVIMVQDEGRFGRISDTRRAWSPPGERPFAPHQVVRQYLYAFVAVAPLLGRMTALLLPWDNTAMMSLFLTQVSEDFNDYFVIMLIDGAGWHLSNELRIPENIRFIQQSSHSPELNPTEHIWEELREKHFHNKAFDSLDDVKNALVTGLNQLSDQPSRIRSMTSFPYIAKYHPLDCKLV
ncbi:MAG: IS630 family transposase [Magnetococcales bacterium]|nr:IS630 family transposase [Magnetococcales bacterium]